MHRTNIYLTDDQRDRLDARAQAQGVSRAELVRCVLDAALRGEADRLESDIGALQESFGQWDAEDLEIDRADGARAAHLARISQL